MTISPVTVTGSFNGPDGSPLASGTLIFRTRRWDLVGSDVVVPDTITATITNGAASIEAYASADGEKRVGFDVDVEYMSATAGRIIRQSIARDLVIPNTDPVELGSLLNDPLMLGGASSLDIQLRQELRDARDQAVTAAGIAAPAAANAATSETNAANSAASAADSASNASTYDPTRRFATVALLLASNRAAGGAGTIWQAEGFLYREASSGATDHHVTTAGGVKLYVLPISGEYVDVAFGGGDSALQTAVNAASGAVLRLTRQHVWASLVSVLVVAGAGTRVIANPGAGLTYSVATNDGLRVAANNVEIDGLTINAPATFDGANVAPTYAVIRATGSGVKVHGCTLNNAPKVGIYFDNADDCSAWENTINGNYPSASFTGTQTGHVGILINPTQNSPQGAARVYANRILGCVQGVLVANYGPASRTQGIAIYGNTFEDCWNHAVYSAQDGIGIAVTGNTCVRCQVPIALTGTHHTVVGNTMQTGGSSGTYTDETGISMRNPQYCVVANNTIQGESGASQVVVNLGLVSGGTVVRGNVVMGNSIIISGNGSAEAIRLGGAGCTDMRDNVVTGNTMIGVGKANLGLLGLVGDPGCDASGTIVSANTVVVRSASHGIGVIQCSGVAIRGNAIRLEHDAASAVTLAGVQLSICTNCDVTDNTLTVPATWGANVTYRGIWETGAGSSGNRAARNTMRASLAKLVSATHYVTLSGSGILVDDIGPGAPNLNAGVGSIWRRTDGGAATTLYVKETGTAATGWVGK